MSQTVARLEVGDVVLDACNAEDDDRGKMRVLEVTDVAVDERTIDDAGTTVADVNPDRYADDQVVEVAFESDLDRRVPDWRDWPAGELPECLEEFQTEWGVSVRTYAFPRGRLEVGDL